VGGFAACLVLLDRRKIAEGTPREIPPSMDVLIALDMAPPVAVVVPGGKVLPKLLAEALA